MVKVPQGGKIAKSAIKKPEVIVVKTPKPVEAVRASIKTPSNIRTPTVGVHNIKPISGGTAKILDENKYSKILSEEHKDINHRAALELIATLRNQLIPISNKLTESCSKVAEKFVNIEALNTEVFSSLVSDLKAWLFKKRTIEEHISALNEEWKTIKSNMMRHDHIEKYIEALREDFKVCEAVYHLILKHETDKDVLRFVEDDLKNLSVVYALVTSYEQKIKTIFAENFTMSTNIQKGLLLLRTYADNPSSVLKDSIIGVFSSR